MPWTDRDIKDLNDHLLSLIHCHAVLVSRGVIVWCNETTEKLLGYSRDELVGKGPLFFFPDNPDIANWTSKIYEETDKNTYFRSTAPVTTKSGERKYVDFSISRIPGKEPPEYLTVCRDATERKHIEAVLRESEQKYRSIVELAPDSIITVDLNGIVTSCNSAFADITGYPVAEVVGKSFVQLPTVQQEDIGKYAEMFSASVEGEVPRPFEYSWVHRDGTRRLGEARVSLLKDDETIVGIQAIARDITERKMAEEVLRHAHDELEIRVNERTEELALANEELRSEIAERKRVESALRQSEELHSALLSNLSDAVFLFEEGSVKWCNDTASQMFGYPKEELLGKPVDFFYGRNIYKPNSSYPGKGEGVFRGITNFERKDGSLIDVEFSLSRIAGRQPLQIVAVARDITEKKKAEETIREAEKRYRAIFDNKLQMVYAFDEKGVFIDANDWALEKVGYTREELSKIKFEDVLEPRELQIIVERMRSPQPDLMKRPAEIPLRTPKGERIWVETFVIPIGSDSDRVWLGIAQDITDRKRFEEALKESEQHYAALVGNLGDAVFEFKGGKITWGNDVIQEILGCSKEEVVGQNVAAFMPPGASLQNIYRAVEPGLRRDGISRGVTQAQRKDGTILDIEYTATLIPGKEPVELVGVARDITERRKMEAALRESEENYRLIFESTFDAIVVVDAETAKIVFGNRRAAELFGFDSANGGLGTNLLDYVHPDEKDEVARGLAEDIYSLDRRKKYEVRAYSIDGREMWVRALATRIEFQGKTAALISLRDVTRQRKEEEEKRRLEEQLQIASRLAAVGELAAGIAHELNNPLAAIQAYAQFLDSRHDTGEDLRRDISIIHREAQRATRITKNLLSFSRKDKPQRALISVNEVIESSLELHTYRLRVNNVELVKELEPGLPKIMADAHQLHQVFANIITNAEQAILEADGRGRLTIRSETENGNVVLTFADNGPGIPEEIIPRIFDPFFTTKEVGKGTGLGLSICYGIVKEHGGSIHVRSTVGKGTDMVVELPIAQPRGATPGRASATD